jgi:hypothetical protein
MSKLIDEIAAACDARRMCLKTGNDWADKWADRLLYIQKNLLPSGNGFDDGTLIHWEATGFGKVVLTTSFHHMDESGGYAGWTEHTVTIRPAFYFGTLISVSGRNRNEIKDYIAETFEYTLTREVVWDGETLREAPDAHA